MWLVLFLLCVTSLKNEQLRLRDLKVVLRSCLFFFTCLDRFWKAKHQGAVTQCYRCVFQFKTKAENYADRKFFTLWIYTLGFLNPVCPCQVFGQLQLMLTTVLLFHLLSCISPQRGLRFFSDLFLQLHTGSFPFCSSRPDTRYDVAKVYTHVA